MKLPPNAARPSTQRVLEPLVVNDREEIFTHCLDGVYRHFPVRPMYETAVKYAGKTDQILPMIGPIEKRIVDFMWKQMGIEQERLDRLDEPYLSRPILAVMWPDEQLTIVDGNHRYVKLHQMGKEKINIFVFRYPFWEQFLLPLKPDHDRLVRHSRMIQHERGEL